MKVTHAGRQITVNVTADGDGLVSHAGSALLAQSTGLRNLPFRTFAHNQVWLLIVRLAHDLICWTQRLLLTGELATAEPKRLRYRPLHIAARLAFHARTATLRLPASWRWATDLAAAFKRLTALPAPA